jgi:hypothetical protein
MAYDESTAINDLIQLAQRRPAAIPVVRDSEVTILRNEPPRPMEFEPTITVRPRAQTTADMLSPVLVMSVALVIGVLSGMLVGFAG